MSDTKMLLYSDLHFGARGNDQTFLDIQIDFFENFLLPKVRRDDVDYATVAGDLFENRRSINLKVLNVAQDLINEICDAVTALYFVMGNHDTYYVNDRKFNSLRLFEDVPNFVPIRTLERREIEGNEFLFVPWTQSEGERKEVRNLLEAEGADVCVGHMEVNNFEYTKDFKASGFPQSLFKKNTQKTFFGHFHIRDQKQNVVSLGTPYEVDWNDYGNDKGIYTLDLDSLRLSFEQNIRSPRHVKISMDEVENAGDLEDNYVRLIVDRKSTDKEVNEKLSALRSGEPLTLDSVYSVPDEVVSGEATDVESPLDSFYSYLENITLPDEIEEDVLKRRFEEIYKKAGGAGAIGSADVVRLKSVSARNFLSVGNQTHTLPYWPGLHLITGYNQDKMRPNGCGKSAFAIDAPFYAFFGKPLRKIRKSNLINKQNEAECEVDVRFDVGSTSYRVSRGEKPKYARIYKNGSDTPEDDAGINETNKEIEKIIGADRTVFSNLFVLSESLMDPFMRLDAASKRDLVEHILGLEVYGEMKQSENRRRLDLKKEIDRLQNKKDSRRERLEEVRATFQSIADKRKKLEEKKAKRLKELRARKKKIERQREKIETKLEDVDEKSLTEKKEKLDEKIDKLKDIISRCRAQKSTAKEKRAEQEESLEVIQKERVCPYCGTDFAEGEGAKHKKEVEDEIAKQNSIISKRDAQEKKATEKLSKAKRLRKKVVDAIRSAQDAEGQLKRIEDKIESTDDQINETEAEDDSFQGVVSEEDVEKAEKDYKRATDNLEEKTTEHAYAQTIVDLLADDGIKAYVMGSVLPYLNNKINQFLEEFGADWKSEFDSEFEEDIVRNGREHYQYDNLSAGEKKRQDLATLLALVDLGESRNTVKMNIQIFDEVLDSGLDGEGVQKLVRALKKIADRKNKCFHLVSHRQETKNMDEFDTIVDVQKKDGFSRLNITEKG